MMKATIWSLLQRTGGWCEPVQKKNLSTFGVGGESHGKHPLSCIREVKCFSVRNVSGREKEEDV